MSAVSLALAGCSEDVMDRINQDTSHTNSVDGKFILADLITSTAFSNVSGDFNTYSSSYVEYEVGIENQLYNAEIRLNEPSASSTFENTWGNVYTSLKNARVIIGQCQEGKRDEGNLVTRGIAEVMEAYNGALLADIFGDTPYSEASLLDENGSPVNMNPKIDKQEEIYVSIMASLDKALVTVASICPFMARVMTFTTYWKAASPPRRARGSTRARPPRSISTWRTSSRWSCF